MSKKMLVVATVLALTPMLAYADSPAQRRMNDISMRQADEQARMDAGRMDHHMGSSTAPAMSQVAHDTKLGGKKSHKLDRQQNKQHSGTKMHHKRAHKAADAAATK